MERNSLYSELAQVAYPYAQPGDGVLYEAAVGTLVRFPSGETLTVVDIDSGKGEEHWDVTGSGHPLLDTSGANQQKMLSRNFSVGEFARNGQSVARIDPRLVTVLQQIRDAIGKPLNITSGYRSYLYNKRLYEKRNKTPTKSKHIAGSAVDFTVAGMNGLELAKKVVDVLGQGKYGIGLGKTFIHLDVLRKKFENWRYSDIEEGWTSELSRYYKNAGPAAATVQTAASPAVIASSNGVGLVGNIANLGSAVIALIQDGITDANAITNFVFQIRHPELKGRKLLASDPQSLKKEWIQIRDRFVLPQLQKNTAGGNGKADAQPSSPAVVSGEKIPPGFRQGKYKGWSGLQKAGGGRVDEKLFALIRSGKLSASEISAADIDIFQRIANVESGGLIQSLNAYDMAIVSIGFMQWTFIHKKIHEWIDRAPAAFARYGIVIDPVKKYSIRRGETTYAVPAVKGVADPESLRWNGWGRAFYEAGMDDAIIVAEAKLAKEWLSRHLQGLERYLTKNNATELMQVFRKHYHQSAHLRGLFQESYNHIPGTAQKAALSALRSVPQFMPAAVFLEMYKEKIKAYFGADKGKRLIEKTSRGAVSP